MSYNELPWLPLCGGLTLLGLIASWVVWRRRGAAAGLRGVAWSLLPLAAYLTKAVRMLWQIGSAIGSFASSLILSPQVWAGVAVTGSGRRAVRGLRHAARPDPQARRTRDGRPRPRRQPPAGAPAGKALKPAKSKAPADDDDLGDVADILRRHGIH